MFSTGNVPIYNLWIETYLLTLVLCCVLLSYIQHYIVLLSADYLSRKKSNTELSFWSPQMRISAMDLIVSTSRPLLLSVTVWFLLKWWNGSFETKQINFPTSAPSGDTWAARGCGGCGVGPRGRQGPASASWPGPGRRPGPSRGSAPGGGPAWPVLQHTRLWNLRTIE